MEANLTYININIIGKKCPNFQYKFLCCSRLYTNLNKSYILLKGLTSLYYHRSWIVFI